jgi:hypothetical protein
MTFKWDDIMYWCLDMIYEKTEIIPTITHTLFLIVSVMALWCFSIMANLLLQQYINPNTSQFVLCGQLMYVCNNLLGVFFIWNSIEYITWFGQVLKEHDAFIRIWMVLS